MEELRRILNSDSGKSLRVYLVGKLNELKDISNLDLKDDSEHQAVEVKSQKKAYLKLKQIMEELIDFSTEQEEKDPKDSYII